MSKNHRTTAAKVIVELSTHPKLNTHLDDPVSLQIVRGELHKSNIHSTAAIAAPLITENNAKRRKRWYDDHKTRTSDDWKYVIWSDESFFTLFPTSGRVCVWRTPKEAIILNAWFQLRNMEAHPCRFGQQNFGINAGPMITLNDPITASDCVDILGKLVHPVVQMLFRNNGAIFQVDRSHTHTHTHTHSLSLSLSHTHTHSLSLTHTHTLSLSHTHTHTHTHTLSLSLSHTHTLSLSHTHTHSLSLSHTHTEVLSLCVRSVKMHFNIFPGQHNRQTEISSNHCGQC